MTTPATATCASEWTDLRLRRRKRLLHSAFELLERRGFDRTSVERIAEHAGISRRTFFNYFPSKESLLAHLHREVTEEAVGVLLDQREARPLEAVRKALLHFGDAMEPFHTIAGAMLRAVYTEPELRAQDVEDSRRFMPLLEGRLAEARQRGALSRAIEPARAAGFLMSVVTGALTHWALRDDVDAGELRELLDERLRWAFAGLERVS